MQSADLDGEPEGQFTCSQALTTVLPNNRLAKQCYMRLELRFKHFRNCGIVHLR